MIFLLVLLVVPAIHSNPIVSHDMPWDTFEYAKNISKELCDKLVVAADSLKLGEQTYGNFRSEIVKVNFNGCNYNSSDDLIMDGSFFEQHNDNMTIIKFMPNYRDFSVIYNVTTFEIDYRNYSSIQLDIRQYANIPILIQIKRQQVNGTIETSISNDIDITMFIKGWTSSNNQSYAFKKFFDFLLTFGRLNKVFLLPNLERLINEIKYPEQRMDFHRLIDIQSKLSGKMMKILHGDLFSYATNISDRLNSLLWDFKTKPWPAFNFSIALNESYVIKFISKDGMKIEELDNRQNEDFNFKVVISENVTTIKFIPKFNNYVVEREFQEMHPMKNDTRWIYFQYKNVPIIIEIVHRIDNGDTKATITYEERQERDWYLQPESMLYDIIDGYNYNSDEKEDERGLKNRFIIESAEFKKSACAIFTPGSTFLQPELENIVKEIPYPKINVN